MNQNENKNSKDESKNLRGILFKKESEEEEFSGREEENEDTSLEIRNQKAETKNISGVEAFIVKQKLLKIREGIDELLKILDNDARLEEYEEKLLDRKFLQGQEVYNAVKIVEGVFDGIQMVGGNGEKYDVPANYASKSKLVEGDILKLRILENGKFIFKQIEKVERKNATGKLLCDDEAKEYFVVLENGRKYKVLQASITYYKALPGDEVVITIPENSDSKWGAVESVRKSM
ncbi:MAG: hypothetical protein V1770_01970 [bacterium]